MSQNWILSPRIGVNVWNHHPVVYSCTCEPWILEKNSRIHIRFTWISPPLFSWLNIFHFPPCLDFLQKSSSKLSIIPAGPDPKMSRGKFHGELSNKSSNDPLIIRLEIPIFFGGQLFHGQNKGQKEDETFKVGLKTSTKNQYYVHSFGVKRFGYFRRFPEIIAKFW